jgi:flagellar motor switch protein FliM
MSDKTKNNLTREKIQQLLSAVGVKQGEPVGKIDADEYDWNVPHYFKKRQMKNLEEFAKNVSENIASECRRFFQEAFDSQVTEITQHYAQKFINQIFEESKKDYYLILNNENDAACGLIILPTETVKHWLKLLLGESETKENAEEQLSKLEESLLCDIFERFGKAVTNSNKLLNLKTTDKFLYENFSLPLSDSEELCKITFDIKQKNTEQNCLAHLLMPCSKLLPIVGQARDSNLKPEQIKNAMMEHAKQLPVIVTARLAQTELNFEQILTLQKGDILTLGKKITEPIELIVQGKTNFLAKPVKSGDRIAAQIIHTNTKKQ